MAPRTRLRYSQIRRVGRVDVDASDESFARGRYFEAACTADEATGAFVCVADANAGLPLVATADVTALARMPAVGVIVEKSSATRCLVQVVGLVDMVGALPGRRYFIGSDGRATPAPPDPPTGRIAVVQLIGVGLLPDQLLVEPNLQCIVRRG